MKFKYKQVIVVRSDLKMSKGKTAVQVAHGSISAFVKASKYHKDWADSWFSEGQKKVTVKVDSEEKLRKLAGDAQISKIPFAVINDAGLTQLEPGTTTVLGIGPAPELAVNKITNHLKLL